MVAPRLIVILLTASLLFGGAGLAQSYPARVGAVASDGDRLDAVAIDRAAAALAGLGVEALALYVEAPLGATLADAERYFDGALVRYGLAPEQSYVIVFVGSATLTTDGVRPLFIELGDRLLSRLDDPFLVDVLRSAVVTPRLQADDPTGSFVAAFEAVAAALASPAAAAPAAPAAVPPASDQAPAPEVGRTSPALLLGLVLLLLGGLWWWRRRSRGRRQGPEGSAELRSVKGELSSLLIDLSGSGDAGAADPFLPPDPEQHTEFVLVRERLRGSDPERLAQLAARYREATSTLERVEAGFEVLRAEEAQGAPEAAALLERYRSLLSEARGVGAFARELAELWQALEDEAAAVPGRLRALGERAGALATGLQARFTAADADAALAGVAALLRQADDERQVDALDASRTLKVAEAELDGLAVQSGRLLEAAAGLDAMSIDLERWRSAGFAVAAWMRERDALLERLRSTVVGLSQGVEASRERALEAAAAAETLPATASELVALQQANAGRIAALVSLGERASGRIEQGWSAFDAVDDYAEANWRDIRGNGSEAQKAADRAQALLDRAEALNALAGESGSQDPEQDFAGAASALDAAEVELDQVEALVTAIVARLEALRASQATARQQLDAVEADLAEHRALLARPEVDREVGDEPERSLAEGARLASEASLLLKEARPDWLAAAKLIQQADRAAEAALAAIRSEREAMERRRLRLASERDEAQASHTRLLHFLKLHAADLSPTTLARVEAATASFEAAAAVAARVDAASEDTLVALLEEAAAAFDAAQGMADAAYAEAEREFEAAEGLRREAAAAVAALEADVGGFERYLRRTGVLGTMGGTLRDLARAVSQLEAGVGPGRLPQLLLEVAVVRERLARARAESERLVERRESALRRERQAQLEVERRRRAADLARRSASWGAAASPSSVRPPRPPQSGPRIPTVSAPKSVGKAAPSGSRRSSGSWGGAKRSKGGW